MMCIYEKLLNIIRNCDYNISDMCDKDFYNLINLLEKHKILFIYYQKIKENVLSSSKKNNYLDIKYNVFKKNKIAYINFFSILINYLNEHKIDYLVYKGLALEKIIYDNLLRRKISDIDIVLLDNNFDKVLYLLKDKFNIIFNSLNNSNEILSEVQFHILYNDIVFVVEFKKTTHNLVVRNFTNLQEIDFKSCKIKTFSYEITFLNLIRYFYRYTESYVSIKYSNRYIFKYPVDLYLYICKYYNVLDWNLIAKLSVDYKITHEIRNCLIKINAIFLSSMVQNLLDTYFPISLINYKTNNITDFSRIEWKIPIISRFLENQMIRDLVIGDLEEDFILGSGNINKANLQKKYILNRTKNNIELKFSIFNNHLIVYLENISPSSIVYLQIYCYNNENIFIKPFVPIYIIINDRIDIYNEVIPAYNNKIIFEKMKKKYNDEIEIKFENNYIAIYCDLMKLGINLSRRIGINVIVGDIIDDKIVNAARLCLRDNPLIINDTTN